MDKIHLVKATVQISPYSPFIMYAQNVPAGVIVVPNVVKGKATSLPESQNFPVINGATGDTVHHAQSATIKVATAAVETAAEAFKSWKKTPVSERRDLLNKAATILERKLEEAAKREVLETSCDPQWPTFDVTTAAKFIREIAASASSIQGSVVPSDDTEDTSLILKEPMGVVLIIPP